MKKYGIVLVGCGHIGQQHLEDIYFRDNIRIVGVVDMDADRAAMFARKFGAEHWATDYRELVALPETDIVIIASWVNSHCQILRYCVEHGKHVLCEKPLSASQEETAQTFRLIRNASVKVQLALILRHNSTYQKIHELIAQGAIGQPTLFRMVQNHHAIQWTRYQSLLEDCSSFFDCGVHYYDVASWFTGSPIQSVHANATYLNNDCRQPNYGMVQMRTQSGCTVVYEAGWSPQMPAKFEKLFVGTKGYLSLTTAADRIGNREEGDLITLYHSESGKYETINVPSVYKPMYLQLCALIHAIENDCETVPSLDEAEAAMNAAFAAVHSAEQDGSPIQLNQLCPQ